MPHVEINKEKQELHSQKYDTKRQKEQELSDMILSNMIGDTKAQIRQDAYFGRKLIDISFSNDEAFWSSGGVVRLEYNIKSDEFRFNNSAGGTNDVTAETIIDAYSDIYASAKNVIKNIRENRLTYENKVDELLEMNEEINKIKYEIDEELNTNINQYLKTTLETIDIRNNNDQDIERLLEKAEQEGRVYIFSYDDHKIKHALKVEAHNDDDVNVGNEKLHFKRHTLSCDVSSNNAKRYYINDQFVKKDELKKKLTGYIVEDSEICNTLKKEEKRRFEVPFKEVEHLADKVNDQKAIQELLNELGEHKKPQNKKRPKM